MTNPSPSATQHGPADESDLAGRARDGDLDAFNALVDLHQRAIYNLCLRMLGGAQAAEDAAQEAFISAWRAMRTFRGAQFRPWLMRIAANACTDELRRRGRRPALSLDAPPPGADDPIDPPSHAPGPEALALQSERRGVIQAALLRLPDDQRLAVILCDIQGYAYDEIARAMGTSVGTVKSRIARGREKLRHELREEHFGTGSRHRSDTV